MFQKKNSKKHTRNTREQRTTTHFNIESSQAQKLATQKENIEEDRSKTSMKGYLKKKYEKRNMEK